ncbi:SDR family oxidoreductase [Streptomyces sp. NPDC087440]|uniref:SDR family oxidoreductase n=1 Tax=Streptomyces sp. NPDC087440 TaxID=3365790 RepID=UPI0038185F55
MLTAITGATGFLGSYLLSRLLEDGGEAVVLLRHDQAAGWNRIECALAGVDRPLPEDWKDRVELVRCDVTSERLGLAPQQWQQLADRIDAVWHSAGLIGLQDTPEALDRVNVAGTRRILELAAASARRPRVVHVSTAFVAGERTGGTIAEDDLDDRYGFLSTYEASKCRAEQMIRHWARENDYPVTVLRPSILLTDRPLPPRAPRHPHAEIGARLRMLNRNPSQALPLDAADAGVATRFPGLPGAATNLVQVEYAADVMVHLARRTPEALVETFHVTHPKNTSVRQIVDVMLMACPWLSLELDPDITSFGEMERALNDVLGGIGTLPRADRLYDRSRTEYALNGAVADPPVIDDAYLRASFGMQEPVPAA